MKLKNYITKLLFIQKKYGGDLDVIYASDEEGNEFSEVIYAPQPGQLDGEGYFIAIDDKTAPDVVCVN